METRRQKIIIKYNELSKHIKQLLNKDVLPDLNNHDLSDLIYLLINHCIDIK